MCILIFTSFMRLKKIPIKYFIAKATFGFQNSCLFLLNGVKSSYPSEEIHVF